MDQVEATLGLIHHPVGEEVMDMDMDTILGQEIIRGAAEVAGLMNKAKVDISGQVEGRSGRTIRTEEELK